MNNYIVDLDVSKILNGGIISISNKLYLNKIISELEKSNHNGIVLTGSNPTLVSVILKEKKSTAVADLDRSVKVQLLFLLIN